MVIEPIISQVETPNYRTEPGKFEYFLVDGLKFPPKLIKPVFDGLYNTNKFIENYNNYYKQQSPLNTTVLESINKLAKKISSNK